MKEYPDYSKTILEWFCRLKLIRFKKGARKKKHFLCVVHIMPLGAPPSKLPHFSQLSVLRASPVYTNSLVSVMMSIWWITLAGDYSMTTLLTANELRSKTAFPVSTQYGLGNCRAQGSDFTSYVRTVSTEFWACPRLLSRLLTLHALVILWNWNQEMLALWAHGTEFFTELNLLITCVTGGPEP